MILCNLILAVFLTKSIYADFVFKCENTTLSLSCPFGKNLRIDHVEYGRTSLDICPSEANNVTNCTSNNAASIVTNLCNGKQNCSIEVNSTVFGNPCPDSSEYLFVDYECTNSSGGCGKHQQNVTGICNCEPRCHTQDIFCAQYCKPYSCVCEEGYLKDSLTGTCVGKDYCPKDVNLNKTHEEYSECANYQKTCRAPIPDFEPGIYCVPGYACVEGYLRDTRTGKCVVQGECTRCDPRWRRK